VAVLTSGTLRRYLLRQAAEGLVRPLAAMGFGVDYYVALNTAEFTSYKPQGNAFEPEIDMAQGREVVGTTQDSWGNAETDAVTSGEPTLPGCYVRLPTGCPNHPNRSTLWRHDLVAERVGVDDAQCQTLKVFWDEYCGSTDARIMFVPRADGARKPEGRLSSVRRLIAAEIESAGGRARKVLLLENVSVEGRENDFVATGRWNTGNHGAGEDGTSARGNIVKMMKSLQTLGEAMESVEAESGAYDFVIILKDDALWLKPFDLTRLLENPIGTETPSGYHLKCDKHASTYGAPLGSEIQDFILVLRRSVATPFYMLHRLLFAGGLRDANSTKSRTNLQRYWSRKNFENFLFLVGKDHGAVLQPTPPRLLPMQRGGRVRVSTGEVKTCLHYVCDGGAPGVEYLHPTKMYPACAALV
jgi:hypothetical protein